MSEVFIYAHRAPCSDEVRYIGKSIDPKGRLSDHVSDARKGVRNHHACWIRSLLNQGLSPVLSIVDVAEEECWPSVESAYIQYFRGLGHRLTNGTEGGEDPPNQTGMRHTPQAREKIGAATRGKKRPPFSEKWLANMRAVRLGKKMPPRSPEYCEAIRQRRLGNKDRKRNQEIYGKKSQ